MSCWGAEARSTKSRKPQFLTGLLDAHVTHDAKAITERDNSM